MSFTEEYLNEKSIQNVVHIGADRGGELPQYRNLGAKKVVWVEANPDVYGELLENLKIMNISEVQSIPFNQLISDTDDVPTDFKGAFLGDISNLGSGTSNLIPLVKIAPRCPPEAALAGTNGEVLLNLVVNSMGRVEEIKLIKANPPRVFNREATKAVRRWQFKPKTVDGVAVEQRGELKVEFICNV